MHPDKFMWNEKGEMIYQRKTFNGLNMKNLMSDVVTNHTKPSSQTFHESAFVKALSDLDVPKDLVKNMKHIQMIEVYKNEKPQTMTLTGAERRKKMVVLNLSSSLVLFYYIVLFFSFSFKSSLATMSHILIRLRDFLKKLKCIIVCCNPQIIIDYSEIDVVDKDGE